RSRTSCSGVRRRPLPQLLPALPSPQQLRSLLTRLLDGRGPKTNSLRSSSRSNSGVEAAAADQQQESTAGEDADADPEQMREAGTDREVGVDAGGVVGVHDDDSPVTARRRPVERLGSGADGVGRPEALRGRGHGRCAAFLQTEVAPGCLEARGYFAADTGEVGIDGGGGADADEDRPGAVGADANGAEQVPCNEPVT